MYVAARTPLLGLHQVIATRADGGERQPESVARVASRVPRRRGGAIGLPLGLVCAPRLGLPSARPFPSSMFRDKNRRDIGKSQAIWTDFTMKRPAHWQLHGGA
jgi:hypothetical protein